jgi:NAD(P)H-flavin reductase
MNSAPLSSLDSIPDPQADLQADPIDRDPWHPHRATITRIDRELDTPTSSVFTLELRLEPSPYADAYRFSPGQFNMLLLPGSGEVAISHSGPPIDRASGTASPGDVESGTSKSGTFLHTIRAVGRVTNALEKLRVGDGLGVRGPYGTSWPMQQLIGQDVLLLSGGLGMAPLRPVVYAIGSRRDDFGRVDLLYGSRSPETILYAAELDAWKRADIGVETIVDHAQDPLVENSPCKPTWTGPVGNVTHLLNRRSSLLDYPDFRPERTQVLLCGPEIMMHRCAQSARKLGIPASSIWLSMERNMQCGVGYCGHCQWGPLFLCKDGPVVPYDLAETLLEIKDL